MTDEENNREEKAEELRDLFMEVTDESTVTEEQEETHGTLKDAEEVNKELQEVVEEMVDEYGIRTKLDTDELVDIVRYYHEGYTDTEIAEELGDKSLNKTVARVRVKLHLFRDSDFDAPFDIDDIRDRMDDSTKEIADDLDVSKSTVRAYMNVVHAEKQAEEAGHRYQERFEEILEDHELTQQLTSSAKDDGLRDATEDMEVDVNM